ncbi:hypothetical protein BFF94_005750 [Burkholderia catarinensis]|nr:hypothetical protein BFF94_005750 [Burkholderia catarinensis]
MTHAPVHAGFACNRTAAWRDTDRHRATRRFPCSVAIIRCCAASHPVAVADACYPGVRHEHRTRD